MRSTLTGIAVAAMALGIGMHAAVADTTLRMWTFLDPSGPTGRERVLKTLIESFEAEHPGVKIAVEKQVWSTMTTKLIAAYQAGNAPDIAWAHTELLGPTIEAGVLENLNDHFVGKWSAEQVADVDDAYWRYATTDAGTFCLTHSRTYFGLIYRIDALRDAGIDPAGIKTWADLAEAARKLTVKNADGTVARWGYGQAFGTETPNPQLVSYYMLDKLGSLVGVDGRAAFATPAGTEGLRMQVDFVRKDGVTPEYAITLPHDDLWDQFGAGRFAIMQGSSTRVPNLQKALGSDNIGYLLWPSDEPGRHAPSPMTGWCVGASSRSEHKDLAAAFVEHMSSPEADKLWVTEAGQAPIRKSTVTDMPEFFEKSANAYLAVAAKGMEVAGWMPPFDVSIDGYREDLNLAAQDVLVHGIGEAEAMQKAADRFNQRHRR